MNYKIILDEDELKRFIHWLPDLEDNELYYLALFSRKKYIDCDKHPHIKADKNHIKRFTANKERLFDKIKQLEAPLGSFTMKGKGGTKYVVPQESLVLYITPNPRNMEKATIQGAIDLMKIVQCKGKNCNPHQEILSTIQRTPSYKRVITFDIDEKDLSVVEKIHDICGSAMDVVETRGGYHVLVYPKEMSKNTKWHQEISQYADVTGDTLLPVPGCSQGMFSPKFIVKNH